MSEQTSDQSPDGARDETETLLTVREAAERLSVHERTIRRAIARGELPATKQGGAYLVPAASIAPRDEPELFPELITLPLPESGIRALPTPLAPFIGRQTELDSLAALLQDPAVRLLTLTGPGGIGKTRLAIEAASAKRAGFPDGVAFVDLAALTRGEEVLPAIAEALGLKESRWQDLQTRLHLFLRTRRLLLLLDNFEHLLDAAPLVSTALANAPSVTVLVTSRAPLRVSGEREIPVPPLTLPPAGEEITTAALELSDAGRLFVARAREHDRSFIVDDFAAQLVADICARLDGLPLAIELAAARAKLLPPRELLARLEPRLPLLTGGHRDAPSRLRTMRDAIAWSYDLLSEDEAALFRRLAVFVGGFTLEAAEYVGGEGGRCAPGGDGFAAWGGGPAGLGDEAPPSVSPPLPPQGPQDRPPRPAGPLPSTLDLLASLLDQSLLTRETGSDGEPRFRMLETVREYALEQLAAKDEAIAAKAAHANYYLAFARALQPAAVTRAARTPLDRLTAEHANLRAALTWLDARGPAATFVGLTATLPGFWHSYSHHQEGRAWLQRASAKADAGDPGDRARVLIGLAGMLAAHGDHAGAKSLFAIGLPLLRGVSAPLDLAEALVWQGAVANHAADFALAEDALNEALAVAESVDDPRWRSAVSGNALANLGVGARDQGDLGRAAAHHQSALRHYQRYDLDLGVTRALLDLGELARQRGDWPFAIEQYCAVLSRIGENGDMRAVAESLLGVANIAAARGQARPATLLFAAAEALRERSGTVALLPAEEAAIKRTAEVLRRELGRRSFTALWEEGRGLSRHEAVMIAATVEARVVTPVSSADLTRRELEILGLLVARRTDREIAETLFLSPRTVSWYVAAILEKLGVDSRHEAAAHPLTAELL